VADTTTDKQRNTLLCRHATGSVDSRNNRISRQNDKINGLIVLQIVLRQPLSHNVNGMACGVG
jgi:hypothetical protein